MQTRRAVVILLIAAVAGTGGGILIARLSEPAGPGGEGGDGAGLGRRVHVDSPAGRLTLEYPDDWFAGSIGVNCDSSDDVHASTHDIELESLRTPVGGGSTCIPELDLRDLPTDAAYVTAAFYRVDPNGCGTDIPNEAPGSVADMERDEPSPGLLREFDAEGSYDPFEWRHATWCVGGDYAVRLEAFLGEDAEDEARSVLDDIVGTIELDPGVTAGPTPT